jgi:hypothetical protein
MIQLNPPWKVATPIGDAEARILDPGSPDDVSRFLCVIEATGETWWVSQRDIRVNTNITEGRTKLTPFSAEAMKRFEPMRRIADKLR